VGNIFTGCLWVIIGGIMSDDISNSLTRIESKIDGICRVVHGFDDKPGLVTKVALLAQSLNKAWWWLGILSVVMLGVAFSAWP
jgi:hypothetical protein